MSYVGKAVTPLAGSNTTFTLPAGIATADDIWIFFACDGSGVTWTSASDWLYYGTTVVSFGGDTATAGAMRLAPGASNGVGGTIGYNGTTPFLNLNNSAGSTAGVIIAIALRGRNLIATVIGLSPNTSSASQTSPQNVLTNAVTLTGAEDGIIFTSIDTTSSSDTWTADPPGGGSTWQKRDESQGSFYHLSVSTLDNLSSGSGVQFTSTLTRSGGSTNLAGYYTMLVAVAAAGGPTISGNPAAAHVAVGSTANFTGSATASGGGSLSWKAQKNGVDISGATGSGGSASYTTPALALSDDLSTYSFVFTETGGSSPGNTSTAAATVYVGWRLVGVSTPVFTTSNGSTVSPNYSTLPTIIAGDKLLLVTMQKPSTANSGAVTTPTGFTRVASVTAQGGYGATLGNNTGNTNIFVDDKDSVTGSESGALSVSLTTNGMCSATFVLMRPPPSTASVSYANTTGSDSSAGNVSVAGAADPGVSAGDLVLMLFSAASVIPTYSAQAITQTGVTFSTPLELAEPGSATGNDIAGFIAWAKALSGTSSAAPTFTATVSGTNTNARGGGIVLRVRATAASTSDVTSGWRKERRGNPAYYIM